MGKATIFSVFALGLTFSTIVFCACGLLSFRPAKEGSCLSQSRSFRCSHFRPVRNLLLQALMLLRPIEIGHIFARDAMQLSFTYDQEVIQTFVAHAAQKTFAYRIGARHAIRNFQDFDAVVLCDMINGGAEFGIIVAHDEFGVLVIGVLCVIAVQPIAGSDVASR